MSGKHLLHFVVLAVLMPAIASPADGSFPRLGGVQIGAPQNYEDPAYQQQIAKLDVAVLHVWKGWETRGTTPEQMIRSIKAINPSTKLFFYYANNELNDPTWDAFMDVRRKVDSMGWWLYPTGGSGQPVKSTWGTNFYILNTTAYTPRDSNGMNFIDWSAKWVADTYLVPNPSVDGIYIDNVFWKPRVDGDWNRDGAIDDKNSPTVQGWFRQGYKLYFDAIDKRYPGKLLIGNVADIGYKDAVFTELNQRLHGGILEGAIGYSYSVESWGSWLDLLAWYRKTMAALAAPKLLIFHQNGSLTDYRTFRYGFTTCLMDDAYYYFSTGDKYSGVNWFDEFDVELGKPTSSPPTAAWQNGIFRRDFEHGIVMVNPKGNGSRTITLEADFQKIKGKQDPNVNSGQLVRTVTLQERDGIVLLRPGAQTRPQPPAAVVAQ